MSKFWKPLLAIGVGLSVLVLVIAALVPVNSTSDEPVAYDEQWCERMMVLPNSQWQEDQTLAFAKFCLVD